MDRSSTSAFSNQTMLYGAWGLALLASLGALFIGEVMGQMPCTLCWYQRTAMFPLAVLLGVAAYRGELGVWRYAIPLSAVGLVIATYHSLQYAGLLPTPIIPCQASGPSCSGEGMLIMGVPIPYLSAAAFAGITLLLLPLARKRS